MLRFGVAESRDLALLACADYFGKAAWYSRGSDPSGVDKVNEVRGRMYKTIPYLTRSVRPAKGGKAEGGMGQAEALMWKFIRERDAEQASGNKPEGGES